MSENSERSREWTEPISFLTIDQSTVVLRQTRLIRGREGGRIDRDWKVFPLRVNIPVGKGKHDVNLGEKVTPSCSNIAIRKDVKQRLILK